jgi:hypothetical protein
MLMAHPRPTEKLLRALEPLMHEKLLLVSFAEETSNPFSEFCISISAVRPSAWSKVLYLPPFYLAHTPGLFGVTTCVNEVASETCAVRQRHHPPGFKL